MSDIKQNCCSS